MIEHEVKLAVWPGFVLPPLDDVSEGVLPVPMGEVRQESVYYDTPDVRLARAGITLRHRSDDGWTLKLPLDSAVAGGLRRDEHTVSGGPGAVPRELQALVRSRARSATLGPIARLQTLRSRTDLVGADGSVLAEIVDDEVSVLDGRRVALRFREVEAELRDGAGPELLDEIVVRLRAAGAGAPDPTPKVLRALGPRAQAPPELAEVELGKHPSAAAVLTAGLARAARRLVEHDPLVRATDDDEAIHQARVATRRMRSDLRTFGPVLDEAWAAPLRDELRWAADLLGAVRDVDVLRMRLQRQLDSLRRPDRVVGSALLDRLGDEHAAARARLLEALDGPRYLALLDRVVEGATRPVTLAAADGPASEVLPRLAAAPWDALAKGAHRLGPKSTEADHHRVRIRAKRARYAAEVAALVVGKPAQRLADRISAVQDVLGEHQDACVAREWLRRAALDLDAPVAFVAGELTVLQDHEAAARRAELPAVWRAASKGKLRSWLKP